MRFKHIVNMIAGHSPRWGCFGLPCAQLWPGLTCQPWRAHFPFDAGTFLLRGSANCVPVACRGSAFPVYPATKSYLILIRFYLRSY